MIKNHVLRGFCFYDIINILCKSESKKFLQDIGLSEKEAAVYLSLLSVDSASVIELSKSTDINRTTLYPILDDLIAKKLVVEIKHDKKVRFQAESPERIETYVQNRKNQLEEQEKVLVSIAYADI